MIWSGAKGILPELFCGSSILWLFIVAQLFKQLTGLAYQINFGFISLQGFTHCA